MTNVLKSLSKSVLIPLELTTGKSATDAAIQKNTFGSGMTYTDNIKWRKEFYMEIIKSLEDATLFMKGVNKIVENEAKVQKG